jgi:transposase-like protein
MATKLTGRWQAGRTYQTDRSPTVFVIEKMRHGRRYTTPLDVESEREALAEARSSCGILGRNAPGSAC